MLFLFFHFLLFIPFSSDFSRFYIKRTKRLCRRSRKIRSENNHFGSKKSSVTKTHPSEQFPSKRPTLVENWLFRQKKKSIFTKRTAPSETPIFVVFRVSQLMAKRRNTSTSRNDKVGFRRICVVASHRVPSLLLFPRQGREKRERERERDRDRETESTETERREESRERERERDRKRERER